MSKKDMRSLVGVLTEEDFLYNYSTKKRRVDFLNTLFEVKRRPKKVTKNPGVKANENIIRMERIKKGSTRLFNP